MPPVPGVGDVPDVPAALDTPGGAGAAARRNPLPPGAVVVALGLGLSGVATYAFFAVASRSLDAASYAAVGVLWSLLFAVGTGVMQPLEQEVARAVAERRARGVGAGPVIRKAVAIGAAFTGALALLGALSHDWILDRLLDERAGLVVAFLIGLAAFAAGHLARGTLSSHGRFGAYALFFATDGVARVVGAIVLAVVGVALAGTWGLVLACAPFIGVVVALAGQRGLVVDGPPAAWGELTRALGWLLLGTVSLALVVQGGTIAVQLLAGDADEAAAGVFLNGLQVARIPLFLFQAVLASLLPRLSRLAGAGEFTHFRYSLLRLVRLIALGGAVATLVAILVGPAVVGAVFGTADVLGPGDMGLLAGTFVVIMVAICFDQALIALSGHRLMAAGWALALATLVATVLSTAAIDDVFLRVELGLAAAGVVAVVWMAAFLALRLRRHPEVVEVTLAEAAAETPLQD
jgi:O-antigen/teichoic acid export membrane protein